MIYRIRYRSPDAAENEAVIEAHSPTEALVKFRCIYNAREYRLDAPEPVISVFPEEAGPAN